MEQHTFFVDKVRIGKKGQITIPKLIRDEDGLAESDVLVLTHTPGGDILLRKANIKTPEDTMLDAISKAPKFDWRRAWAEVEEERRQSER